MSENNERKFLHDVASPLATAFFLLDMTIETLGSRLAPETEEMVQLRKVHDSLKKINQMLTERREALINLGAPSSKK